MNEQVTGTSIIRAALRARNRKINLSTMARDLDMQITLLEDFAEGRAKTLAPDLLRKITTYIWTNGTRYNAEADALESNNVTPPTTLAPGYRAFNPELVEKHSRVSIPAFVACREPRRRRRNRDG